MLAGSGRERGKLVTDPFTTRVEDTSLDNSEHSWLSMSLPPQFCVHQVVPSPMNCRSWLSKAPLPSPTHTSTNTRNKI